MTGNEIRKEFLDYFSKLDHTVVRSSPLTPKNDPTLLFTNAGMVQFKNIFLGSEKGDYRRAVSVQKCVRAGGKHNDLENVGRTARHHTFFEMLGNFSFGDYFKKEAIEMGWEFLTKTLGLSAEHLWVSVYEKDDDAYNIWHKDVGISSERIVRMGEKDNFWSMGETGPCGPCSEILIDQGEELSCGKPDCKVGCDCDRYLELWNLVFMQYDRNEQGELIPLPKPSIDTGLGLERITAVLQGVKTNYDSDLFKGIIKNIEELSGEKYEVDKHLDISIRVIADHIRANTFLISDGVMPSNEGRGYVLRRIIRRAARHGRLLGIEGPFLYKIAGVVVEAMKEAYPELVDSREYVAQVTLSEEERFGHTLDTGMGILDDIIAKVKEKGETKISGGEVFKLYDTYGFPMDLTRDIAGDCGVTIDEEGFNEAMTSQKERARASWVGSGEEGVKEVYKTLLTKFPESDFVGYQTLETEAEILALIKDDKFVDEVKAGDEVEIILNQTPFYAQSGGQVGDRGVFTKDESKVEIKDTQKPVQGYHIHQGFVKRGAISVGDKVMAKVDKFYRESTSLNHTSTHLLQAVLRRVLGDHIKQAGSLVSSDRLRFDFTHFSSISQRELNRIERLINEAIRNNYSVELNQMKIDEAINMGAVALFGEKYGEEVRVIKVDNLSTELCGGTHIKATGDIGVFKLIHEGGVAAGVRRIEALTGEKAYEYIKKKEEEIGDIAEILKAKPDEVVSKVEKLLTRAKDLEKEVSQLKAKLSSSKSVDLLDKVKVIEGIKVLSSRIDNVDIENLRNMVDEMKNKLQSGVIVMGTAIDDKVVLIAGVTKDLTNKLHAGQIVKEIAQITGGGGGGRPDLAQAGGKETAKLNQALDKVYEIVKRYLMK